MPGSVLMDRMQAERDFELIGPVYFSTANAGSAAPVMAKNEGTLKNAGDIESLKKSAVIISCQGVEYTPEVFPKQRAADCKGHCIDAGSSLRMNGAHAHATGQNGVRDVGVRYIHLYRCGKSAPPPSQNTSPPFPTHLTHLYSSLPMHLVSKAPRRQVGVTL